jgi:hypothetical protein
MTYEALSSLGKVNPAHPLQAIRRTAIITDVSNMPATCTVLIGGDITNPQDIAYVNSYTPVVGDNVILLSVQGNHIIVGSIESVYFEEWQLGAVSPLTATLTAPATVGNPLTVLKSLNGFPVTPMDVTTAIWTCPASAEYTVGMQSIYASGAGGSRIGLYALRNANTSTNPDFVIDANEGSGRGRLSFSGTRWFNLNDTLKFQVFQATGSTQTLVANTGSDISIRKV